ncbi:molybdopterin-dependent oxidoreductase [Paludisphaera mucosa]|uniref:Molybdopterin-dependent oxidoreductase n=1 Tax=Paludisphaera mucosa TaxID=3030827 RepID=A0ABT6F4D3_9BACT|nr:molybdopterin-dependent oxidoreductase [Paludisphaera mucosa]MDG3002260.1 molybdopterin-dependent oxidoreductase [Paludisphaera mucosa]
MIATLPTRASRLGRLFLLIGALASRDATAGAIDEPAAPTAPLRVQGRVDKALSLTETELAGMPRKAVRARDQGGAEAEYEGVPLFEILQRAGLPPGGTAASWVVVEGSDGHRAVFATAELDPAFADRVVLLADRRYGRPIAGTEGPLRVVVPGEKSQARWVRMVVSITVQRPGPNVFGETAERLRDARTLSYRCSSRDLGVIRSYERHTGPTRTEIGEPPVLAVVTDVDRGEVLILDVAGKFAFHQNLLPLEEGEWSRRSLASAISTALRSLAGKEERPDGRRPFGDVLAEVYRVDVEGRPWTFWIDPGRKSPLLVESSLPTPEGESRFTLTDFRIDPPIDDALFRLEPPEGYVLRDLDAPGPKEEEALVDLLRFAATASGGRFPTKLDASELTERFPAEPWEKDRRLVRWIFGTAIHGSIFARNPPGGWHGYSPDEVKLGNRDRIVFWHHPWGQRTYRAVFGDLHVENVTAEDLPPEPDR